jgi:tetratricopeptide (TPR) repeat protein
MLSRNVKEYNTNNSNNAKTVTSSVVGQQTAPSQEQPAKPAKPDTMHLRTLLNQTDAHGRISDEAVQLWTQHADEALARNDRVTTQLLLQLLDKLPVLPPLLAIYREYCQGMLASLRTDAGAMYDYFTRGLELLGAYETTLAFQDLVGHPLNETGGGYEGQGEKLLILKAILQTNLANALVFANNVDEAETLVLEALPALTGRNLLRPQVRGLTVLFKVHYCRGQIEKALNIGQQALAYARRCDDQYSIAKLLQLVGICHLVQNAFEAARVHFEEALVLSKIIGHSADMGTLYNNLAIVYEQLHSYKEALVAYETALTLCTARGDKPNMVTTLTNIGSTNARLKRYSEAYRAFTKGLKIARENVEPSSLLLILSRFTSYLAETVQPHQTPAERLLTLSEARQFLAEALVLHDETDNIRADYLIEIYTNLCRAGFRLALNSADYARSYFFWQQTLKTCQQLNDERSPFEVSEAVADIFLGQPSFLPNVSKEQPQTGVYEILAYWWRNLKQKELSANSTLPLSEERLRYILHYAGFLSAQSETKEALLVYRVALSRLVQIQDGTKLSKEAEVAYIEAAKIAPPTEAIELLEEFLLFAKAGLLSYHKSKDIEILLKGYRKHLQ